MIGRLKGHARRQHLLGDRFAARAVPDSGIGHCGYGDSIGPLRGFAFQDPLGNGGGGQLQAGVGFARYAAVPFPIAVYAAVRRRSPPAHGKGTGVPKIKGAGAGPVCGDGKRRDHMGVEPIAVVIGLVVPFAEHLPGKGIPVAHQVGLPQRLGQPLQGQGIFLAQVRVIGHPCRDEFIEPFPGDAQQLGMLLDKPSPALGRRVDKGGLHPGVPDAARIGGRANDWRKRQLPRRADAAFQEIIYLPGKVSQFIQKQAVDLGPLVGEAVLCPVAVAKKHFAAIGQPEAVACCDIAA